MELSGGLRVGLQWPPQPFDVNPIKIAVAGRIQVVASELASNGLRKFQCGEIQKDQQSDETKRNENKKPTNLCSRQFGSSHACNSEGESQRQGPSQGRREHNQRRTKAAATTCSTRNG